MQRPIAILTVFVPMVLVSGCEGPVGGSPLGLGPGLDQMVWVGIVGVLIVALYRPIRRRISTRADPSPRAEDVARERYARGELTREEYARIMKDPPHEYRAMNLRNQIDLV